jgi:hypothetical protein
MLLKEEIVIDLQAFICYYKNNVISYDPVQVYLDKYRKLFNRYKIYLHEIDIVDSEEKIQKLLTASIVLEMKIGLYKSISPLFLELTKLKYK